MKKIIHISLIGVLALMLIGVSTSYVRAQGSVIRSGESVSVESHQILEGDFYAFGSSLTLSGEAKHDMYVAGGDVTINGSVTGDLGVVGGVVQVHGTIGDDVRILGGEVTIAEPVEGDVVVLGGTLTLLSTATVGGDVLVAGGEVRIEGPVEGSVYGTTERMRITGKITGDVHVQATNGLTLGETAVVTGNVRYMSNVDIARAQGAVIGGTIQKEAIALPAPEAAFKGVLFKALITLFAVLTVFLALRRRTSEVLDIVYTSYGRMGLIGFGVFFIMPFVSILLASSILGMIVGMTLLLIWVLLGVAAWVLAGMCIGTVLNRLVFKRESFTLFGMVLGTFVFAFLPLVPYVGVLLTCALLAIALGAVTTYIYRALRQ